MKKDYNAPTINVEIFKEEEILLTSAGSRSKDLHNIKDEWIWCE